MPEKNVKERKNSAKLTGGSKFIKTPDVARLFVTTDKKKLKTLKKCAIDLEIEVDDVLSLSLDVLIHHYERCSSDEIEEKGRAIFFEAPSIKS